MRIPNEIKLGGHTVKIRFVKSDEQRSTGMYDTWFQLIKLNTDDVPEDIAAEAFLHEIIEAVSHINDLKLEHTTICVISESVFAAIRNNNLDFREGK